ncbi:MAG: DUF6090 family protein [Planctomycetota bacterium]|jgi:hypothetical protein
MQWRKLRLDWAYAIGELAIVVVGVLIALGVNNWNEERLDRRLEHQYMGGLVLDLLEDTLELGRAIALAEQFAENGTSVLSVAGGGDPERTPADFLRSIEHAGFLYFPIHTRPTYDELVSTGNLSLLRDAGLKRDLAAYYAGIERTTQWKDNWRVVQRRYEQWVPVILDLHHRNAITLERSPASFWVERADSTFEVLTASSADAMAAVARLRSIAGIEAALKDMIWVQGRHRQNLLAVRIRASELLGRLERALTR